MQVPAVQMYTKTTAITVACQRNKSTREKNIPKHQPEEFVRKEKDLNHKLPPDRFL